MRMKLLQNRDKHYFPISIIIICPLLSEVAIKLIQKIAVHNFIDHNLITTIKADNCIRFCIDSMVVCVFDYQQP